MRKLVLITLFSLTLAIIGYTQTIVYYDPDGNLKRIVDINSEGNKLFGKIGLKFVVTADENSFNNALKQYNPEYFILNSIIYQSKNKELNLSPVFLFKKGNKTYYTKKVVTFSDEVSMKNITSKILASSFKDVKGIIPYDLRILKVPKDLDALLAMKFMQADAALVSENSIDIFKTISPVDYSLLKVISTSREIYNPVFCYSQGNRGKVEEIKKLILSPEAKGFLSLLLFDGISEDISNLK
ncbi:MAG: hypothetical protein ACK4F9_03550 [Brevinematia bacterium]